MLEYKMLCIIQGALGTCATSRYNCVFNFMQFSGQNNRLALPLLGLGPKTLENLESGFVSVTDNSLRLHLTTKNLLTINYIKDRS